MVKHQPGADADKNDSDVLNRMIGEQSFQVVLHQRVQHAQQCGDHAYGEHETTPPRRAATQQIECDPHEAVHAHLNHHAGH